MGHRRQRKAEEIPLACRKNDLFRSERVTGGARRDERPLQPPKRRCFPDLIRRNHPGSLRRTVSQKSAKSTDFRT